MSALLAAFFAAPAAGETLTYTLAPNFERGVLRVELTWQTGERKQSFLSVSPRWGRIENVAAMLRDVQFAGASARQDGNHWILSHRPNASLRVSYTVDPRHRAFDDWRYTHHPLTTAKFFHGMGNAFLLVPHAAGGVPDEFEAILRWQLPAGYQAVCSWGAGRHIGARMRVNDLRHSVYLAGKLATHTVEQEGRTVTVAMVDEFAFDAEAFAKMTTAIIKHQCDFMAEPDFPDFVVTAIPVGERLKPGDSRVAGSGLYNSFALYLAPQSTLTDAVEHLFAHELFHYWNGRLLPAREPERLVYWFVEGLTDYYALRILLESGYWDADTYAKWVNKHLREYAQNPAIHATNDEIERSYWSQRETVGEVAYQRGLLLGLRWHALARDKRVPQGFDRLFRRLVERGRSGGFELTNTAVRAAGIDVLGTWFGAEFDRYVVSAATVDVPPDALAPQLVGAYQDVYEYEPGFDRQRSLKDRRVHGLKRGSAAEQAGLREGDELVGWSLFGDPDRRTRLRVKRGGRTESIEFYPRGRKLSVLQFRPAGSEQAGS